MHHTLSLILAAEDEPSKTPFYIAGGALAAWAVILSAIGLTQHEFPGSKGVKYTVCGISAILVAFAMSMAVVSS